jgi:hypothetical protein
MKASIPTMLVAGLAVALAGCGTVCNLAGGVLHPESEPRIYGGFLKDVEVLEGVMNSNAKLNLGGGSPAGVIVIGAILGLAAADPFLCIVADTATLPLTVPLQARRNARAAEGRTPNGIEEITTDAPAAPGDAATTPPWNTAMKTTMPQ